ncbi:MAG TPA: MFS transporter [Blastocatellia bacterium]|jgi:predicted MFS family arabinose efflux permease|nr:MFS transporter [Blastocatellia bacterium]
MKSLALLKSGNLRMLFGATVLGTVSEVVFGLTSIITVSKSTGSALSIGVLIMLTTLPSVFLSAFQGVVIDRFDKGRLAVWANLLRAAVILVTAAAIWAEVFSLALLYVAILTYYILWYFLIPNSESLTKEVLPKGQSTAGLALIQGACQMGVLASAPMTGLLMDKFGLTITFAFAASMDIAGAIFYKRIKLAAPDAMPEGSHASPSREPLINYLRGYAAEIREGWKYIAGDRQILLMVLAASSAHPFFQAINTLLAPFVFWVLGGEAFEYGLIDGGSGLGSLISAMLCLSLLRPGAINKVLLTSEILLILTVITFSMTTSIPAAFVLYVAIGIFAGNLKVLSKSIVLEKVHRDFSGRVMSAVSLLGLALGVLTCLGAGVIADRKIFYAYGFAASIILLPVAATLLFLARRNAVEGKAVVQLEPLREESIR